MSRADLDFALLEALVQAAVAGICGIWRVDKENWALCSQVMQQPAVRYCRNTASFPGPTGVAMAGRRAKGRGRDKLQLRPKLGRRTLAKIGHR